MQDVLFLQAETLSKLLMLTSHKRKVYKFIQHIVLGFCDRLPRKLYHTKTIKAKTDLESY
jgi:hypothetical protein